MFCQNCGTKNNDTSIFCENCGVKLEKPFQTVTQPEPQPVQPSQPEQPVQPSQPEQPVQPSQQPQQPQPEQPVQQSQQPQPEQSVQQSQQPQPEQPMQQPVQPEKPKKHISKLWIAVAVEVVAIIALVAGFFKIGNMVYGPEKVAEKFFVEVANQNYKEAYKVLDVEENDFINEEAFENAKCNVELNEVTDYQIKRTRGQDDEKEVKISYKTKGSSSKHSYDISVEKQNGKNLLFFEDWQISPEAMLVEDFYVCIPAGAEVTVDGVKLGKDYLKKSESDEYQQYYVIPEIFAGEHQIVVTQEGMQEVRRLVDTDSDYGFYLYDMKPDEKMLEEVLDTAIADMNTIYISAAEGKDFDTIADLFSTVDGRQEDAKEDYEDIVYGLTGSSYTTLNKISFSNIEGIAGEGYGDTDEICISVQIKFDYSVEYTEEWFGEVSNESYDSEKYMYMDYVYENGKWLLEGLDGAYLYY